MRSSVECSLSSWHRATVFGAGTLRFANARDVPKVRRFVASVSCGPYKGGVFHDDAAPAAGQNSEARFASTHWSVVLAAAKSASPEARAALDKLCRDYWYPLYAFLRRKGHNENDAKDLTQQFFAERVVNRRVLQGVKPGSGRFRSWLLTCLENLVSNQREKELAQKRGGNSEHLSLDFQDAEGRYLNEPADLQTADKLYERAWAFTLLDRALEALRFQHESEGKGELFQVLREFLPGEESCHSYAEVAGRLGKSEESIKMAVSRLRQQYGKTLRAEIKRTVNQADEIDEELRHLMQAVGE